MSESLSSPLSHFLSGLGAPGRADTPTRLVQGGAACVQAGDLAHLRTLLPALHEKTATADSAMLRRRLALLLQFVEETPADAASEAQREIAFALYYFLRGGDLIPDHVPEIGLLDDALLLETAFRRNEHELRTHWSTRHRAWPTDL